MCICETWLTSPPSYQPNNLRGLQQTFVPAVKTTTKGRAADGIILFYNEKIYSITVLPNDQDYLLVKVSDKQFNINFILGIIRSAPSHDIDLLPHKLNDLFISFLSFGHLPLILGGDFDSRIANLNDISEQYADDNLKFSLSRSSLNPCVNTRGRKLVEFMDSLNLILLIGRTHSDTPANITYPPPWESQL